MFTNSIKTILAAGIIAAGAAVTTTTTANAGSSFGIYIGSGHGHGIHSTRKYRQKGHRSHRFNGKRHGIRHAACGPRRALNKAYRVGVNRPHVARINHKKIVVVGYSRGYPAKVVFKRKSRGCKIIRTRGLH
jgi:tRNA A-37 threonylcarbamoyl transferase component Bud32